MKVGVNMTKWYFVAMSFISAIASGISSAYGRMDLASLLNVWAAAFAVITHIYKINEKND